MSRGRLEALSDGVIAIIITIMVLELKPPVGSTLNDLTALTPVFLAYILSFVILGIYWNNHHHLFQTVQRVGGSIMWTNLLLLFWLSLIPFTTAWMGRTHFAQFPSTLYGFVLLMCSISYSILQKAITRSHGPASLLRQALGRDFKGKLSIGIDIVGIVLGLRYRYLSAILYAIVAIVWFVPDRRISTAVSSID